jgi:proteasome lid subunit RPN8/RPN11
MELHISSQLLGRILDAAAASDEEICGLLIGTETTVSAIVSCRNIASHPHRRFEIDPAALFAAHRAARRSGEGVLGHYHSHPTGSPVPSPCDAAEAAADGAFWLIVGAGEVRAWRAVSDGAVQGRFDPVRLAVTPPCAPSAAPPEERG